MHLDLTGAWEIDEAAWCWPVLGPIWNSSQLAACLRFQEPILVGRVAGFLIQYSNHSTRLIHRNFGKIKIWFGEISPNLVRSRPNLVKSWPNSENTVNLTNFNQFRQLLMTFGKFQQNSATSTTNQTGQRSSEPKNNSTYWCWWSVLGPSTYHPMWAGRAQLSLKSTQPDPWTSLVVHISFLLFFSDLIFTKKMGFCSFFLKYPAKWPMSETN